MNHDLRWFAVSREDIVDVLLGEAMPRGLSTLNLPDAGSQNTLVLGYKGAPGRTREVPSVVILEDDSTAEVLSWIRVYADDVFPISQFARVVQHSDWKVFDHQMHDASDEAFWTARWASVAVGETLGQSEAEVDLQNMPLSRIASSLSLPVGRTTRLFGGGEPTRLCVERLRAIVEDNRFGRRAVGVDQLTPVWAMCGARAGGFIEPDKAVDIILSAYTSNLSPASTRSLLRGTEHLSGYPGLRSDSVEERVMAFTELSNDVSRSTSLQMAEVGALMLASGCFLVGRGTSHVFLLNRFQRVAPTAFTWFGLIAAMSGPRFWDGSWLRAVKGAERLLRADFSWGDVPSADVSWCEFSWLASMFDDVEQLASLPKMLPRTLGVEVVPGVVLQVRLGYGPSEESKTVSQSSPSERHLSEALNQILQLALHATGRKPLLSPNERQQPLDLPPRGRASTSKRYRQKKEKSESGEY
ncbi:hypothetical protein ACOTJD_06675 [Achromobacter xylosoxidans]